MGTNNGNFFVFLIIAFFTKSGYNNYTKEKIKKEKKYEKQKTNFV